MFAADIWMTSQKCDEFQFATQSDKMWSAPMLMACNRNPKT